MIKDIIKFCCLVSLSFSSFVALFTLLNVMALGFYFLDLAFSLGVVFSILFNYCFIMPKIVHEFDEHSLYFGHNVISFKNKDIRREFNYLRKLLRDKHFWIKVNSLKWMNNHIHNLYNDKNNSLFHYVICFEQFKFLNHRFDIDEVNKDEIIYNIDKYIYLIYTLPNYDRKIYLNFMHEYFPDIMEELYYKV